MAPRTPLLDPTDYFSERETAVRDGLLAFGCFAVANGVLMYVLSQLLFDRVTGLTRETRTTVVSTVVPSAMAGAVVAWIVVAAVMHYLGGSESNSGTFGDALAVAGWAYVPDLLVMPLSFLYVRERLGSLSIDATDPSAFAAELEAAQAGLTLGAIPLLLRAIAIGWSVYVLAYGTAETHDAPLEATVGAAALVGIGSFVLTLFNLR